MSQNNLKQSDSAQHQSRKFWKVLNQIFRLSLFLAIVIGGYLVASYWMQNKPKAKRKKPEKAAALVTVTPLIAEKHPITVRAMGNVIPSSTIDLSARISGEIIYVSPEFFPGGRFEENDVVIKLDREDYELSAEKNAYALEKAIAELAKHELTIEQRKNELTKFESDLKLEKGQQAIAKREYDLLRKLIKKEDEVYVMRQPQLNTVEAAVAKAKSAIKSAMIDKNVAEISKKEVQNTLKKTKLDLSRTTITAPFNCIVSSKNADLGSQVSPGSKIVSLIDTNRFWIEASIPVEKLKWIDIPDSKSKKASKAKLFYEAGWGVEQYREGHVKRLLAELEAGGRMARLLIEIEDPLCHKPENAKLPTLLLGTYVRIEIEGKGLDSAIKVPRYAIRDGSYIWIMLPDNTLDIRKISVIWGDNQFSYIRNGIKEGELLITSDLPAWLPGMALTTAEDKKPAETNSKEAGK